MGHAWPWRGNGGSPSQTSWEPSIWGRREKKRKKKEAFPAHSKWMLENKFFRRLTSGRTSKPEEVIDASEQLHSHVVVDQGVLQHARLQAQVSHVFPHPPLAALLIVPEIKQRGRRMEGKQQLCERKGSSFPMTQTSGFHLWQLHGHLILHIYPSIHMYVRRYARIYIHTYCISIHTHTNTSISLLAGGRVDSCKEGDCVELH